ncbi:MAG: CHAP domain-containing protein [Oscillospiraceae bacterium]|nr:CHAP domain-containing protein [Oscillospiraceae bacterium]
MATAADIIKTALCELGVTEYPPRSNNVKYNTAYWGYECYGDEAYPWCMAFVWWVFREAGAEELIIKTASCPTLARWSRSVGKWVEGGYRIGDVLLFRFGAEGYDHVGIVEAVNSDGTYSTIEGNTSLTSDDNGGAVMRRVRYPSQIAGAYRPDYDKEPEHCAPAEEENVTYDEFIAHMARFERERAALAGSEWSETERTWAQENGIFIGDGSGDMRWRSAVTREELAVIAHRLSEPGKM